MIRTGGSLIAAARAYRDAGAVEIDAIATHGVFPGDALERLTETGLFSAIACTDTHPRARELAGPSLHVAPHRRRSGARAGGVDMKQIAVAAAVVNQVAGSGDGIK